jgi:hypothetical protein
MIHSRPASAADIAAYYGQPARYTMRATAILRDETIVGLVGLATIGLQRAFFSESKPELGADVKSFCVRRAVMEMAKAAKASVMPVVAVADGDSDVLARLGFTHVGYGVYAWLY